MTIRALLSGFTAKGVWHIGTESNTAQTLCGMGLLLLINNFTILIVAGHMDGTRRSGRINLVVGNRTIACQHENIIAKCLPIVGTIIPGDITLGVKLRHLAVCLLGDMAAIATWIPRRMARDTRHIFIGVGATRIIMGIYTLHITPNDFIAFVTNGFCDSRLGVKVFALWVDGVSSLNNFPDEIFFNHAALIEFSVSSFKPGFA